MTISIGLRAAAARLALASALWGAATLPAGAQDQRFVSIGTGGVTGVYYPLASTICDLISEGRARHGVRCAVESTAGSVDNLDALAEGRLEMAIVQTDGLSHAVAGTEAFAGRALTGLAALLALHAEPFTILARADAGIEGIEDLRGRNVNIGRAGSGQRATLDEVMAALDMTEADFGKATDMGGEALREALCAGEIDAAVFTIGHPAGTVAETAAACPVTLVPVAGPAIDGLVAARSYYRGTTIPGGLYPGSPDPVPSFAVGAVLVSGPALDGDIAGITVEAALLAPDRLAATHPAMRAVDAAGLLDLGPDLPRHPSVAQVAERLGLTLP